jgi:hypothetical protein
VYNTVEETTVGHLTVEVAYDDIPVNPFSEWDVLGKVFTISCRTDTVQLEELEFTRRGETEAMSEDMEAALRAGETLVFDQGRIWLALDCYEHGGVRWALAGTLAMGWDTSACAGLWTPNKEARCYKAWRALEKAQGQVSRLRASPSTGEDLATLIAGTPSLLEHAQKRVERLSGILREMVHREAKSEIELLNKACNGEVYTWTICDAAGELLESCGGYFDEPEYVLEEGVREARAMLESKKSDVAREAALPERVAA